VRLLASRPTLNLEDRVSLFVWLLPLDLSGMGAPTSCYATAGIALRVSGALKPHHHDKVETSSVGEMGTMLLYIILIYFEVQSVKKQFKIWNVLGILSS
jgi:hypothetical protein